MANTGVKGRVVDELGADYAGLIVAAYDKDALFGDERLGWEATGVGGGFQITYSPGKYGLEANPDIVVRVYDRVRRVVHETLVHEDVAAPVLDVGTLVVRRDLVEGFAVTLGTDRTPFKSTGNSIEVLVDNELAWDRLTTAIENAQQSIRLMQLYFDVWVPPTSLATSVGRYGRRLWSRFTAVGPNTQGIHPEDELAEASRRGVDVRIILNDARLFYGLPILGQFGAIPSYPVDTANRMNEYLTGPIPPHQVHYRPFPMPMQTPMHSKVVVIDGKEAFTIGSPFLQEYYDDRTHRIDNPKRGWMTHGPLSPNQLKVPIHDVSAVVHGPVVADLDRVFCLHWNQARPAGDPAIAPAAPPPPQPGGVQLQVIRSLRGEERYDEVPQGEDGLWEGYQRAFAHAQDYIYAENQYVTSPEVADALMRALKTSPTLQVILVLNNKVDIPGYATWQRAAFERMLKSLTPDEQKRLRMFLLWTHEPPLPGGARPRIVRNYVHSKVTIVDDRWATVGSANFDSVSLTSSQHIGLANMIFRGIPGLINLITGDEFDFRNQRNSETNVAIFNDDGSTSDTIVQLRRSLWAEHLGLPGPDHDDVVTRPADGWITRWIDAAEAKRQGLAANPGQINAARILPLPHKDGVLPKKFGEPAGFLEALSIPTAPLDVLDQVRSFSFTTGAWLPE